MGNNAKKTEQLGMPVGTASNRLKKAIMFSLIKKVGLQWCYQCGGEIVEIDNLSIEHKVP